MNMTNLNVDVTTLQEKTIDSQLVDTKSDRSVVTGQVANRSRTAAKRLANLSAIRFDCNDVHSESDFMLIPFKDTLEESKINVSPSGNSKGDKLSDKIKEYDDA